MIEIPVKMETKDYHYYHVRILILSFALLLRCFFLSIDCTCRGTSYGLSLMQLAFFTTREVNAFEELTWVSDASFCALYIVSIVITLLHFCYLFCGEIVGVGSLC